MTEIKLYRYSRTYCYCIDARISMLEKLEHIMPVLMHLYAKNATLDEITTELFAGFGILCQRILKFCHDWRLVRQNGEDYEITDLGIRALNDGGVFMPQSGLWEIGYQKLGALSAKHHILEISAATEDVNRQGQNIRLDTNDPTIADFHSYLKRNKKKLLESHLGNGRQFRIEKFGLWVRFLHSSNVHWQETIKADKTGAEGFLHVMIRDKYEYEINVTPPRNVYKITCNKIAEANEGRWDYKSDLLYCVPANERERTERKKTIRSMMIQIGDDRYQLDEMIVDIHPVS